MIFQKLKNYYEQALIIATLSWLSKDKLNKIVKVLKKLFTNRFKMRNFTKSFSKF